ncbi:MAG TPA: PIN domain protein [Candidatus Margulisbacteria bacterium]|nr:PIN domain protein [Candidatus Margulisiibacteriota bacterium]
MHKIQVYLDTSVIGGYFDKEFEKPTKALFDLFIQGVYTPVISKTSILELEGAPSHVKDFIFNNSFSSSLITVDTTPEIKDLSKLYLQEAIISAKYEDDAIHIATATVYKIDVLVSWNFKHIVNLNKIRQFNAVNLREGYGALEIRTPMEVLNNEEKSI